MDNSPNDDRRLARAAGVMWRSSMRGVLVSVPSLDEPVLFGAPGDAVWDVLAEPHTAAELADVLAGHFDADAEQIRTDLKPVIAHLLDIGALVRV